MRRIGILLVLAMVAMLAVVTPARADFHGLCTRPPTPSAGTSLTMSPSSLDFAGQVTCGGATTLTITSLTLTQVAPAGATVSAPPASCSACNKVTDSASAPVQPGIYDLVMKFVVVASGKTTPERTRFSRYLVAGTAQPVLVCGGQDNTPTTPANCA